MSSRLMPLLGRASCALLLASLPIDIAMAAASSCSALNQMPATLEVGEGLQQQIQSPVAITRLAIGDPKIADVQTSGNSSFLLTGMAPGATSLMVWTACATAPRQSMVFVKGKASVALTGPLPSEEESLPSQVQTDIRFVEVSRTKLKEASASIFGTRGNFLFGSPKTLPTIDGVVQPRLPVNNDQFNFSWIGGKTMVMINALEGSGFAYTLARPSLVALSGQSASFLAGGEVPIPVPSSGSDNVSIEYKEFGIRLTLTPTVIDRNRISLKVAPEVSELDYSNAVQIQGIQVPALVSVSVAFTVFTAAFLGEIWRGGIQAVPKGQTEASKALGLHYISIMKDVVLPQAFKISLPPLVSNFVALLKDSSLAYAIGVVELTNVGNRIQSATFQPIATLSTVAITYLLLTTLVTQISNAVEYRFDVEGRNK